ncbi:MAG TPA: hypothetical protein VFD32_11910 [Dehalococcoidia bacterium]|nr:hypothetical protein [Dehalococcoidia bacterium]
MGAILEQLCAAVERWDGLTAALRDDASEETGAWYVLGYLLERPEWRKLVEPELQELPSVAGMRHCLTALSQRGGPPEDRLVPHLIHAVDAQLESLSEDHALVVRRRRRWLADAERQPNADPAATQRIQALLTTEAVWEEMRRHRLRLVAWREATAGLLEQQRR